MSDQNQDEKKVFFIPSMPNARYDTSWHVQAVVDPNAAEQKKEAEKLTFKVLLKRIGKYVMMGAGVLALIAFSGTFVNWLFSLL